VSIKALQTQRNAETRSNWESFAAHRQHVSSLLARAAASTADRLCVLGAGNCNDLALDELLTHFGHIDLVDLDATALAAGVVRQVAADDRIGRHGDIDVTGILDLASKWRPDAPASDAEVDACIAKAQRAAIALPNAPFQVTASVCLLSQLVESLVLTLGETHAKFLDLLKTIRLRHLELLFDLTRPGGTVLLISDIVSSLTCPQVLSAQAAELPRVVADAVSSQNFFTGVNPFVLRMLFETEPQLAAQVESAHLSAPWLWDLGPRTYAVCAVRAVKS